MVAILSTMEAMQTHRDDSVVVDFFRVAVVGLYLFQELSVGFSMLLGLGVLVCEFTFQLSIFFLETFLLAFQFPQLHI